MITVVKKFPVATHVFDTYWKFAAERQDIFFNRIAGNTVLTSDPILLKYKFTNAYRAADRVSQYLISRVIYNGEQSPNEILFRILLFKLFNKIETWEMLLHEIGDLTLNGYSFKSYSQVLHQALKTGERVYSGAYMMPSGRVRLVTIENTRTT